MATPRICSIPDCGKTAKARGWCEAHYLRWRKHGDPQAGRIPNGEASRFLEKEVLTYDGNNCLMWPYSRNQYGYGKLQYGHRICAVHRIVCEAFNGPAPSISHEAAHLCGAGHLGCVTGRHLVWKTHAENEKDKVTHGTHPRGSRNPSAKLTEDIVREVKSLQGVFTQRETARMLGISYKHVNAIVRGRIWGWL